MFSLDISAIKHNTDPRKIFQPSLSSIPENLSQNPFESSFAIALQAPASTPESSDKIHTIKEFLDPEPEIPDGEGRMMAIITPNWKGYEREMFETRLEIALNRLRVACDIPTICIPSWHIPNYCCNKIRNKMTHNRQHDFVKIVFDNKEDLKMALYLRGEKRKRMPFNVQIVKMEDKRTREEVERDLDGLGAMMGGMALNDVEESLVMRNRRKKEEQMDWAEERANSGSSSSSKRERGPEDEDDDGDADVVVMPRRKKPVLICDKTRPSLHKATASYPV